MTVAIFIFSFILSALRPVLPLSSSSRSGLLTSLERGVHGHTALAVYRAGGERPAASDGQSRDSTRDPSLHLYVLKTAHKCVLPMCLSFLRASLSARGRLTASVSTSAGMRSAFFV